MTNVEVIKGSTTAKPGDIGIAANFTYNGAAYYSRIGRDSIGTYVTGNGDSDTAEVVVAYLNSISGGDMPLLVCKFKKEVSVSGTFIILRKES